MDKRLRARRMKEDANFCRSLLSNACIGYVAGDEHVIRVWTQEGKERVLTALSKAKLERHIEHYKASMVLILREPKGKDKIEVYDAELDKQTSFPIAIAPINKWIENAWLNHKARKHVVGFMWILQLNKSEEFDKEFFFKIAEDHELL